MTNKNQLQSIKDPQRKIRNMTLIVACIIGFFVVTAVVLLTLLNHVMLQQTRQYLGEISNQCRAAIEKQIEGDLLTIQGVSAFFDDTLDEQSIIERLETENNRNSFIRMSYIDRDYRATVVDIDGSVYTDVDMSDQPVIEAAMNGTLGLSDIMHDRLADKDIVLYAAPVYQDDEIVGVMGATRSVDSFSTIIQQPLFGTHGLNLVIRQNGEAILALDEILQEQGNFLEMINFDSQTRKKLEQAIATQSAYTFSFEDSGRQYWGTINTLGYNDWYLVSVVPAYYINQGYQQMMFVFIVTILLLIVVFSFLLLYTNHIRHVSTQRIEHLAYYDDITGAYNTHKFMELAAARLSEDKNYALVLLDLHGFKFINASFGFSVGDRLLCGVSDILSQALGADEIYYHRFADQFGFLLHTQDESVIRKRVTAIMDAISAFELVPGDSHPIHCYCGIKVNQHDSKELNIGLMQDRAAAALAQVKNLHGNHLAFYDHTLLERAQHKNHIEQHMHAALRNREFIAYLQPKYDLHAEQIVSAEALVRWQRPDGSLVPPGDFIPIFEQNGFITQLDLYIFEEVCRTQRRWLDEGLPIVPISVNQSRLLFYQKNYLETVHGLVSKYDLDPKYIIIEVTESLATNKAEEIASVISGLHALGFSVSMDDFGSGYSSLNVLRKLSIDELKLDRDFLSSTELEARSRIILRNILELARELHITTVCEGVETRIQSDQLRDMGCDIAQGYFFSRPIDIESFTKLAFGTE